jgi:hypothetical protein
MTTNAGANHERLLQRLRRRRRLLTSKGTSVCGSRLPAFDAATSGSIASSVPVGRRRKILIAPDAAQLDLSALRYRRSHAAAEKAVTLIREGRAEMPMNGALSSDEFLGTRVRWETGLRAERSLSNWQGRIRRMYRNLAGHGAVRLGRSLGLKGATA